MTTNSVTESRIPLSEDEVNALRRATRVEFNTKGGRGVITVLCREPLVVGWGPTLRHLFPVVDKAVRLRHIDVGCELFARLGDTDVPGDTIASAFHAIDYAEQDTAWRSVAAVIRPSDVLTLSFRGNAPGQLPDDWHVDQLSVRLTRHHQVSEVEFVVATEIRQGRARMVHLIDPEIVDRCTKEG